RADDRGTEKPAAPDITEGELHRRDAALSRQLDVGRDRLRHDRFAKAYTQAVEERKARHRQFRAVEVLAGEDAAAQRAVGEQRHLLAEQNLGEIVVDVARHEAVAILNRHRARDTELARDTPEFANAPRGLVRQPVVADFSSLDQPRHAFDLLANRRAALLL